MTDKNSEALQGNETTGMPLRLVRGDASPEEIAALVAILAAASGEDRSESPGGLRVSQWNAPGSRVRKSMDHGPGGWRASVFPH